MKPYISADIGGSHISCAAVDPEIKQIISGTYFMSEVNNRCKANDIIKSWSSCLQQTINKVGNFEGIGLAMPGPFDYTLVEKNLIPDIEISELKEKAALPGAARLVNSDFYYQIEPLLRFM